MENGLLDTMMYDAELLSQLDWTSRKASFKNGVSPTNPGDGLVVRPLCSGDYDRGYMKLLSQLTNVGDVTKEMFLVPFEIRKDNTVCYRFHQMCQCPGTYYVTVIEDTATDNIIGTASLIIEQKFIHKASQRGRIEDVVVNMDYRGKQLGKLLVETQTLLGKLLGVYKMSLECSTENVSFYQGFGYVTDGNNFMVQRYKD